MASFGEVYHPATAEAPVTLTGDNDVDLAAVVERMARRAMAVTNYATLPTTSTTTSHIRDATLAEMFLTAWTGWTLLGTCRVIAVTSNDAAAVQQAFLLREDLTGIVAGATVKEIGYHLRERLDGTNRVHSPAWADRSVSSRAEIISDATWYAHFGINLVDLMDRLEALKNSPLSQFSSGSKQQRLGLASLVLRLPFQADPQVESMSLMAALGSWPDLVEPLRTGTGGPNVDQIAESDAVAAVLWPGH